MARRTSSVDGDGSLGRKRTADILRELRSLNNELKMLKKQIDTEQAAEAERIRRSTIPRRRRPPH